MNDLLHIINYTLDNMQRLLKHKELKKTAEAKSIVSMVHDDLETIKKQAIELKNEYEKQKIEIELLRKEIAGEHGFELKYNVYYNRDGDGPFCPFCAENKGKRIRLRQDSSFNDGKLHHACRICENTFCE